MSVDRGRIEADADFYDSTWAERLLAGYCKELLSALAAAEADTERLRAALTAWYDSNCFGVEGAPNQLTRVALGVEVLASRPGEADDAAGARSREQHGDTVFGEGRDPLRLSGD